ncbi:MAG: hypothetical protein JO243_18800 [Solirubrobacterales bacterium]|nr:hypothetical protein [Solirubrobacterales bacterium]
MSSRNRQRRERTERERTKPVDRARGRTFSLPGDDSRVTRGALSPEELRDPKGAEALAASDRYRAIDWTAEEHEQEMP